MRIQPKGFDMNEKMKKASDKVKDFCDRHPEVVYITVYVASFAAGYFGTKVLVNHVQKKQLRIVNTALKEGKQVIPNGIGGFWIVEQIDQAA